jgi:hypothetical protein
VRPGRARVACCRDELSPCQAEDQCHCFESNSAPNHVTHRVWATLCGAALGESDLDSVCFKIDLACPHWLSTSPRNICISSWTLNFLRETRKSRPTPYFSACICSRLCLTVCGTTVVIYSSVWVKPQQARFMLPKSRLKNNGPDYREIERTRRIT